VIAISPRPVRRNWVSISFASTLYLYPVLDLLLAEVPTAWKAELRLGLQEALVNAAKHGNNLDPAKTVSVRFSFMSNEFLWVISDEGSGFNAPGHCQFSPSISDSSKNNSPPPHVEQECGRGLFILYQIFDRVEWNTQGTELTLCKELSSGSRLPYLR
jgi:anti-sigma regulatory factor (Ser/Thr protein kinase)